ncbi:hypothetical protein [Mycolicibacterium aichiense]|uniref:Uncharacterized protein n=1 Tax=Mycolicibacterium aichiense TaxID=1799 RepID=A0A378VAF9_9MYCO|nr:hypothetical protein [Mycolicibacterium aichiense]QFG08005.1 hypothetical protein SEA_HERBERTWM_36 [Mycobacterium phage Herbertwm]MCV7016784.1 hypothetical protein [Mycolicibacterium aichiense]SUA13997.1 Uncharacterised protein [Mycolicibacterium aichiense]SUA14425.1 Uncharacterised protein [Mycolicibacterium aichiense]BBX09432.1 hypothetical protein MAIC_42350 [Mycolicibacterium aichiense]
MKKAKLKAELTSWRLDSTFDSNRLTVEVDLPPTGMRWGWESGADLARMITDYAHYRSKPYWRRVWDALRGL